MFQLENYLLMSALVSLFETSSLSDISIALFGGMIIAATIGFLVRRVPGLIFKSNDGDGQEAYVVSAVLGLLALLLGFTFSLALARYEDRRELVLQESNAIGTAYLRAQLLNQDDRTIVSQQLVNYAKNRLELAGPRTDRTPALLERNDELLMELWAQTRMVLRNDGATPVTGLFIASINDVIDLDAARKNARSSTVPSAVYAVLMVFILISAAILGYSLVGFWARFAAVVLFFLLSLSMLLIIDIDRPLVGFLREQQTPMIQLIETLGKNPPQRFEEVD